MKTFQQYLDLAKGNAPFSIDDSWAQGRSVFGGLSAALLLTHIEENTGLTDKELRSIHVQFCSALKAGEPVNLRYSVLSSGKSVTNIQATLSQNNETRTFVTCCFASERDSAIEVNTPKYLPSISHSKSNRLPFIQNVTPNFIQHLDLRLTSKNMPFTGSQNMPMTGWMHFENKPLELNDSAILALIDAWPPAVLPMMKQPAPASSVTWNVEFFHPRRAISKDSPLYYECVVTQASHGLAHTEARIVTKEGELVALSRQVVAVYDKKS